MSVFSHFTRNKFFFHFFTHMHMALWFKWSCMNRKYIHKIIIIHKTNILNINNSTNGVIWDSIPVIIQLCLASSFDFWLLNVHNNKGNCREGEDDDNKGSFLLKLSEKMWKGIFCLNTQKKKWAPNKFHQISMTLIQLLSYLDTDFNIIFHRYIWIFNTTNISCFVKLYVSITLQTFIF